MPHKLIATNTFFQILTRLVSAVSGFIITIIIARVFGVTGYGDYTKIIALVGLFYVVVDFGLNALFLQDEDNQKHFTSLVVSRSILAILLIILVNIGLGVFSFIPSVDRAYPGAIKIGMLLYSITIFSQGLLVSASAFFQKKLRFDKLLITTALGSVVSLILVARSVLFNQPLTSILVSLVIGSLVTGFSALYVAKETVIKKPSLVYGRQLFYQSLPLGIMLVVNLIYFRIDAVLLSLLSTTEQVGLYGFSYRFFDFLLALPLFLSNSLYPSMLHLKNTRSGRQMKQYYYAYGISGFVLAVIVFLAAPLLTLVRPDFAGSVISLRILVVSLPLFFFTSFFQWILIANKKELKFLVWIYVIFGTLTIVANVMFIPRFGYLASATITDISEACVFVALAMKTRSFFQAL